MREDYFQPDAKYVELHLNGEYQGLYLLAESIEETANRLDIEKHYQPDTASTPFIVELDFNEGSEVTPENKDWRFTVNDIAIALPQLNLANDATNVIYTIKYPEKFSDVPEAQAKYIKDTINNLHENAKSGKPLNELGIDLTSFVNYFLFHEIFKTEHVGESSTYYYSDGKTIFAGPLWDFDILFSYNLPTNFLNQSVRIENTLYQYLLKYPEFKDALSKRFNEVYAEFNTSLRCKIQYLKDNTLLKNATAKHENLYHRNSRSDISEEWYMWNGNINAIKSVEDHLDYIQGWLLDGLYLSPYDSSGRENRHPSRLEWLKEHLSELE
jgi:hypothetical protein